MSEELTLKGIPHQQEIGFLTLYEAYDQLQVESFYKQPKSPIWIICSESHYSVCFALDSSLITSLPPKFDIVYYDELAHQSFAVILSLTKGGWTGPSSLSKATNAQLIPPIDAVLRTKWKGCSVDWNGVNPIL